MKRMLTWMLLLGAIVLTTAAGGLRPLPTHRFLLQPESRIWIDGSSTVNTFTCEAGAAAGSLIHTSRQERPASLPDSADEASAVLTVPVRSLNCGQRRMERDLYEALKADDYPEIRYELSRVDVFSQPETDAYALRATGRLTVAGTTRQVETTVLGQRLPEGRLRATGSQPLLMTDFGIDPPTALFGLIKARDRFVVRFDLVAAPEAMPVADMAQRNTP